MLMLTLRLGGDTTLAVKRAIEKTARRIQLRTNLRGMPGFETGVKRIPKRRGRMIAENTLGDTALLWTILRPCVYGRLTFACCAYRLSRYISTTAIRQEECAGYCVQAVTTWSARLRLTECSN